MTDTDQDNGQEHETLSRCDGQKLAKDFRDGDRADPFPEIPPALLSAKHIRDYVFRTGAIAPFDTTKNSGRLKKAAYEGRIGCGAYQYDHEGNMVDVWDSDNIVVQANSIIFVECDLDFRLPDFLALRFNLQIRHVHRGLLLGTGPLIDPGYWGKLCIPLHNLTDRDYSIPRSEGLIWMEFTKTSFENDTPVGRDPLENPNKQYWSIREFIEKAARPLVKGKTVPIRSSIPSMTKVAEELAKGAEDRAQEAEKRAQEAAASAEKIRNWVLGLGVVGVLVIAIALVTLVVNFYSSIQNAHNLVEQRIDKLEEEIGSYDLPGIREKIQTLNKDNSEPAKQLQGPEADASKDQR